MPYLILAYDHPGMEAEREAVRELHRTHLASAGTRLLAAGAILDEDGQTIVGGMTILDTDDRATAELFAGDDPYEKAGVRKQTEILRWRKRWWSGAFVGEGTGVAWSRRARESVAARRR